MINLRGRAASAEEVLQSYGLTSLVRMARQHGMRADDKKKGTLVRHLASKLYDQHRIQAAVQTLGAPERRLLNEVILADGQLLTVNARRHFDAGAATPAPGGNEEIKRRVAVFDAAVAELSTRGLVFTADVSAYKQIVEVSKPGPYLYIPDGVLRHLPGIRLRTETTAPPAVEAAANTEALFRDLYVLVAFAQKAPIPLTTRGQLPKRTFVQIDEAFRFTEDAKTAKAETDLGRLPWLRALAEDLGLLERASNALQLGVRATQFLGHSRGQRSRLLYDAYRRTQRWSELSRLPRIAVTPRTEIYPPQVVAARARVLAEVTEMPAGQWVEIDHLIERIRRRQYEFLLSRIQAYTYYYGSSLLSEPSPYAQSNPLGLTFSANDFGLSVSWSTVEGAFIRAVVTEALHWLGLVDLGVAAPGEAPSVFRLTPDGATILHGGTPASAKLQPNVVIQPNFQVFAFEPTGEDVLFTLDRVAERIRAEQVVEYRLTRESVYAATRTGMEIREIIAFLERVSSKPLPQNVRRSLDDWGSQLDRIVVRREAALLQAADERTLDALYADRELARLLGRRLSPTAAMVSPGNLETIRLKLIAGRESPLPALSEGDDSHQGPSIWIDDAGRITFRARVPSMYAQAALSRLADETEGSSGQNRASYQLTISSLRRAAGASLSPDDVIARLEKLSGSPLPEAVTVMIRRHAKHWGRGTLANAVLLRVEDGGILTELMADPELAPHLERVPGSATIATVRHDRAEKVRELLQERGMELSDQL